MDTAQVFAICATHKDVNIRNAALLLDLLAVVGDTNARLAAQMHDIDKHANVGTKVSGLVYGSNPFLLGGLGLAAENVLDGSPR